MAPRSASTLEKENRRLEETLRRVIRERAEWAGKAQDAAKELKVWRKRFDQLLTLTAQKAETP